MNNFLLLKTINLLKKWQKKGDVSLEDFQRLVNGIEDPEVKRLLTSLITSSGDEDKLRAVMLDLFKASAQDEEVSDIVELLFQ